MFTVPHCTDGIRPAWFSYRLESIVVGIGGAVLMLAPFASLFVK